MGNLRSTVPSRRERGFSLSEMLVVLAFIGITVGIGIPLVSEQMRIADARGAADRMAVQVRAQRMIAVAHHADNVITVNQDPTNSITYLDGNNQAQELKMPGTVTIMTGSSASITFHSDGSTAAASTIIAESVVSSSTERWTITVSQAGLVQVAHVRI